MLDYVDDRIILEGQYIAEHGATVRETAAVFKIGKSTVHKDMTEKLENLSFSLYQDVKKVLEKNLKERHLRGGEATKRKYQQPKK